MIVLCFALHIICHCHSICSCSSPDFHGAKWAWPKIRQRVDLAAIHVVSFPEIQSQGQTSYVDNFPYGP
jgi:hypothetical protein